MQHLQQDHGLRIRQGYFYTQNLVPWDAYEADENLWENDQRISRLSG